MVKCQVGMYTNVRNVNVGSESVFHHHKNRSLMQTAEVSFVCLNGLTCVSAMKAKWMEAAKKVNLLKTVSARLHYMLEAHQACHPLGVGIMVPVSTEVKWPRYE
jgi:hypothetical protein